MAVATCDPRAEIEGICADRIVLGGTPMICVADAHPDPVAPPDHSYHITRRPSAYSERHYYVAEYPRPAGQVGLPLIGPTLGTCVACEAPAVAMVDDGTDPGRRWPMCSWHAGTDRGCEL